MIRHTLATVGITILGLTLNAPTASAQGLFNFNPSGLLRPIERPVIQPIQPTIPTAPGTIAVQTNPAPAAFNPGPAGGPTVISGAPAAPAVQPGQIILQIPPGAKGPNGGGTIQNSGNTGLTPGDFVGFAVQAGGAAFGLTDGKGKLGTPHRPAFRPLHQPVLGPHHPGVAQHHPGARPQTPGHTKVAHRPVRNVRR